MSRFHPQGAIHRSSRRHCSHRNQVAFAAASRKDKNAPGVIVKCVAGGGIHTKSEEAVEIVTVLHPSSRTAVAVVFDISIAKNNDNGGKSGLKIFFSTRGISVSKERKVGKAES